MMSYEAVKTDFLDCIKDAGIDLHSFLLIHNNDIVVEHYEYPFHEKFMHRFYSSTKSFAGMAVVKMVDDGLIKLDDKICDLFKDCFDMTSVHPFLLEQTVRDSLMMATCYDTQVYSNKDKNWLERYFLGEPSHPSGTLFYYDSAASYLLGALVKQVTGKDFLEYLRPVLDEIGFSKDAYCLKGPDEELWASSGLVATTRDLAKFANLLLNGGEHNGKQLISKELVLEAISAQIANFDEGPESPYSWYKGYGYQIWIMRDNSFLFNGMGSQFAIGFPERNLVFACNADTQGYPGALIRIFDAIWNKILPNFPKLNSRYNGLLLEDTLSDKISGIKYIIDDNKFALKDFVLDIKQDSGCIIYNKNEMSKKIPFSLSGYKTFYFPEKYNGDVLFSEDHRREYQCISTGKWIEKHKLMITVKSIDDYIGNLTIVFSFKDDMVAIKMTKNAQFFFDDYNGFFAGKAEKNKI
ncbi:MAG: serine hydrolase [Clostridia bacterium]|nr:serine hydrolase [Clostridia bacterium]